MPDSDIKKFISDGIKLFGLNDKEPYQSWHDNLFEGISPELLSNVVRDDHFVFVLGVHGVWNKFDSVWRSWSSDLRNVASKVRFMSFLYSSFVYPRDEIMNALIERLPDNSLERGICSTIFTVKDNEYWHIRNAIAHGHIDFSDDTDEVIVKDNYKKKRWEQRYECGRLFLDSLIITDIFRCIFERVRRIR